MRTNKELLQLVLDKINQTTSVDGIMGFSGICGIVKYLYNENIISSSEEVILDRFISTNRPKKGSKLADPNRLNGLWYWEPHLVEPRVRWLKYHIRICKS